MLKMLAEYSTTHEESRRTSLIGNTLRTIVRD